MMSACVCLCVDSSLVLSQSSSCVTCVFLHFFALLFLTVETGSGTVLSVSRSHDWAFMLTSSNNTAHLPYLCSTQTISLPVALIYLTCLGTVAHLLPGLNSWHSLVIHSEFKLFPAVRYTGCPKLHPSRI